MTRQAFYACRPTLLLGIRPILPVCAYTLYFLRPHPRMFGKHATVDLAVDALPLS